MMRSMLAGFVIVGAGLVLWQTSDGGLAGAAGLAQEKKKGKGVSRAPYVHTVIFHLKKDTPADAVDQLIADAHSMLAQIPSVKGVWMGRPAAKATPKFTEKFDVGLLVILENADGLYEYLDHKLHTDYVEKHGKHFERVQVYDFLSQKK